MHLTANVPDKSFTRIMIYNISGVKVKDLHYAFDPTNDNIDFEFSTSDLKAGIYIISLKANNQIASKKFRVI